MASEGGNIGDGNGSTDHPAAARPASAGSANAPKLRRIEITNYKAIDHLVLEIPAPVMASDADIFVVGSKNGVGKTSLLECCAIAHTGKRIATATIIGEELKAGIRSGAKNFTIDSSYAPGSTSSVRVWDVDKSEFLPTGDRYRWPLSPGESDALFGRAPDPLIHGDLLLFHSHRRVAEGPMHLQEMLAPKEGHGSSAIKLAIMSMMLAKSGLLEGFSEPEAESRLERLNDVLSIFAGGRLDKLRTVTESRLDIRIATPTGSTFSFDALSSGQKEIVSTLFLIWNETRHRPSLVLIDEPELHLNAEWQREFIYQLHALAPQNQYILATHSEEIFASVSSDRRVLLGPHG